MADPRFQTSVQTRTRDQAVIDEGLRAYMLRVYNYMASGVALTGVLAYVTANTPALLSLLYAPGADGYIQPTMLGYAVMFSPLIFVMVLSFGINRMKASTAQLLFWLFAGVMGLSLSHVFLALYRIGSIARTFFVTAAVLRRAQPVRLHHQARPSGMGFVPDHGPDRA